MTWFHVSLSKHSRVLAFALHDMGWTKMKRPLIESHSTMQALMESHSPMDTTYQWYVQRIIMVSGSVMRSVNFRCCYKYLMLTNWLQGADSSCNLHINRSSNSCTCGKRSYTTVFISLTFDYIPSLRRPSFILFSEVWLQYYPTSAQVTSLPHNLASLLLP